MSECNCCCAYLNPPWWVTMGYAPPVRIQAQASSPSQSVPAISDPPAQNPPSRGTIVQPPAPGPATQSRPTMTRPTAAQVATDIATGNPVAVISDLVHLLGG
jgi:hypothetical protein